MSEAAPSAVVGRSTRTREMVDIAVNSRALFDRDLAMVRAEAVELAALIEAEALRQRTAIAEADLAQLEERSRTVPSACRPRRSTHREGDRGRDIDRTDRRGLGPDRRLRHRDRGSEP